MTHGTLAQSASGGGGGGSPGNSYGTRRVAPFTGAVSTHAGVHVLITDANIDPSQADPNVINGIDYGLDDAAGLGIQGIGVDDYAATNKDFTHQNANTYHTIATGQVPVDGEINIPANSNYEWRVVPICPDNSGKASFQCRILNDTTGLWDGVHFTFDDSFSPTQASITVTGTNPALFRGVWANPAQATGFFVMAFGINEGGTASTTASPEQSVASGSGTPTFADTAYLRVNIV
tara:strand:- start:9525 stop:10226 length:702 start_codon:yes stop_codon:yes gene_type:complete